MAFNFNGSNRSSAPSNNSPRKDIDYSSMDSDADSSSRSSGGFGAFDDRSSGSAYQFTGFDSRSDNSARRQTGFQDRPTGFSNRPENRSGSNNDTAMRPVRNSPTRSTPRAPAKRPATQRSSSGGYFASVPWRIVPPIIGIIILVILCVVFREAITAFLTQVLAWIIIILIIVFLVKWFIFGGIRRK